SQEQEGERAERGRLGVSVQNLTPQLASQLGTATGAGVVLIDVDPGGPAADAGLRRGDIILEANRNRVSDVDDLEREMNRVAPGGDLLLRVERPAGGQSSYWWVSVKLD
ncbi:MAG TPA: PDZ domain-containing protein, partial [Vicinamibacteria bacterium]|nr:PDZ domain-containing protein [Vicinamibacteria bacterium]